MSAHEANRTVGAWVLTDENRARRVIQGKRADGKTVTVCIIEDWVREEDAVLLASSRDLLASLNALYDAGVEQFGYHDPRVVAARAAIAKAEGRS